MATQSQLEMSEKRPTLCVDVLVHVMASLCKNGDVVNMMSTCRDLHVHGLRILLSQPLSLRASGQRSQEILAYILADKSRRPRLLRSLEVVTPGSSHGAALSEVLRYSTNLRELTLNLKGASIPEGLPDAIGTLASLRHLFINAGSFTEKILAAVHAPLTSLKLVGNRHSALLDLYTLIAPFADSLQDLNASNVTIRPFPVQFPRVHRLSLRIPQHPLCRQILSAAFPKAQSLFLDTRNLASDVDPLALILEEQYLRSSNISETRTPWKSLQTVHGDIATLHRLGLESTAQCMVLTWSPIASIDHYAAVFNTLKPRLLAFTSSSCRLVDWKEILEKAPSTTHLHFTNVIRPPRNGTIPAYVQDMLPLIQTLPMLLYLEVFIRFPTSTASAALLSDAESDQRQIVQTIADSKPSLRHIYLMIGFQDARPALSSMWEISSVEQSSVGAIRTIRQVNADLLRPDEFRVQDNPSWVMPVRPIRL